MLEEGTKVDRGYATVADDEGDNYRDIAETMSLMGYRMNHSSARNYVLRVMKKLAQAYANANSVELTEDKIAEVAKSPAFQNGVADLLHIIEGNRRLEEQNT